ncbi:MAG: septation protein A [Alphaproteobacteria bacterium]|nr:septation protein A [Alphaproteobacteria bacterium]
MTAQQEHKVQQPASGQATQTPLEKVNPVLKLILEMGPLVAFFIVNSRYGIFPATAVLMVCVVVALIGSRILTKHWPVMPIVTAVAVLFFGALTIYFSDELFIKLKPTIVNSLFGAILLIALAFGKPLLPVVLDSVMRLTDEGWRKLTLRWGLFFFVLAALNEIVWRTQTTDFWVTFKTFGIMPLTIAFALSQLPLIMKHEIRDEDSGPAA